jgi:hypothetical protein
MGQSGEGIYRSSHRIEHALRRARTDAGQDLHQAEARDLVEGVLHETQHCQDVFDMCGIQELQSTKLDEGNVPARQLNLQCGAVMRRAEKHHLLLPCRCSLAIRQDALDNILGLIGVVADRYKPRPFGGGALRP